MITVDRRSPQPQNRLKRWLLDGIKKEKSGHPGHEDAWWKVMCLTGVDYFSTLGYAPGIAFLAAGVLSPIATIILVLLTLFGALPVYRRVAQESPHGQGSISMLESQLPGWRGKAAVLLLLGFAATDFIITITLSAADATAHILENPFFAMLPLWMHSRIGITLVLLLMLGAIFLAGFREAIGVAVVLVFSYLALNAAVLIAGTQQLLQHPQLLFDWKTSLFAQHHSPLSMLGLSALLFPKLALGMSGFETGVAVMPLIKGDASDNPKLPAGRIRGTRWLLTAAAVIMSVFLLLSSLSTTLLISPELFQQGGEANGRALAYLAHKYLGNAFGTAYDISSILILWFAGASALAGLLNLVPRYLPRYGMAPSWASAVRPLVISFTLISFAVTIIFKAEVDAQAGAYATGVLVLITSAAVAVTLSSWKSRGPGRGLWALIALLFVYTSFVNMVERPEGLQIASFFIAFILVTSLLSRAIRSFELRIKEVKLDPAANEFIKQAMALPGGITLLSHRPGGADYAGKEAETRKVHRLTHEEAEFIFLEVSVTDASEFIGDCLVVSGHEIEGHKVLRCDSPAIPNAIAAILLHLRDETGSIPDAYFGWTEGHPLGYVFKYIFLGEGETAPVAREILREEEPDASRRPRIIVG